MGAPLSISSVHEINHDIVSHGFTRVWEADNIAIVVLMLCLILAFFLIAALRRDIKVIVQENRNDRNLMFDKFIGVMNESTAAMNGVRNSVNVLNERIGHD